MREAVIVSTARTPIGKAYSGAFNNTTAPALAAIAMRAAIARADVEPEEVGDITLGAGIQMGTSYMNVARHAVIRAGLPVTIPAQSIDRACSSGLMAISAAARQIIVERINIAIGGGVESISMNQSKAMFVSPDPWIAANKPSYLMTMLETAEIVAERYRVSRESLDEYALQSQRRTAAAIEAGLFDAEIIPVATEDHCR